MIASYQQGAVLLPTASELPAALFTERQLAALLLLTVIVVHGWLELASLTASATINSALGRMRSELVAATACHSSAAHACCAGGVCTMGKDCRCGAGASSTGAAPCFRATPCHPTMGQSLFLPHSAGFRFLSVSAPPLPENRQTSRLALAGYAEAPGDGYGLPLDQPPKQSA